MMYNLERFLVKKKNTMLSVFFTISQRKSNALRGVRYSSVTLSISSDLAELQFPGP